MADTVIRIIIMEQGSKQAAAGVKDIGDEAKKAQTNIAGLTAYLATQLVSQISHVGSEVLKMTDEFTKFQNRLAVVTTSTKDQADVTKELLDVAQRTRQPLEQVGEVYFRLAETAQNLNLTQEQLVGLSSSVLTVFNATSTSATQARNAVTQLSVAFENGSLSGRQFRSLIGSSPLLVQQFATAIGVSTAELRKMGSEGKLTSELLVQGLSGAAPAIQKLFESRIKPTIEGEINNIKSTTQEILNKDLFGSNQNINGAASGIARNFNIGLREIFGLSQPESPEAKKAASSKMELELEKEKIKQRTVLNTLQSQPQKEYVSDLLKQENVQQQIAYTSLGASQEQAAANKIDIELREKGLITQAAANKMLANGETILGLNQKHLVIMGDKEHSSLLDKSRQTIELGIQAGILAQMGGTQAQLLEKENAAKDLLERKLIDRAQELEYIKQINAQSLGAKPDEQSAKSRGALLIDIQKNDSRSIADEMVKSWNDAGGAVVKYGQTVAAITENVKNGAITQVQSIQQIRDAQIALLDKQTDVASGFERGYLKMQKEAADFASASEKVVTDAFHNMEDAIVDFTHTGKLNFSNLVNGILDDITRLLFRQAVTGLLGSLGGGGGLLGGLFGGAAGGAGGAAAAGGVTHVTNLAGAFADGGTAQAGRPYMVGEKGPEVFTPGQTGQVHPNGAMGNVNIVNTIDPSDIIGLLNSRDGQDAIVNVIKLNKTATKNGLGIS